MQADELIENFSLFDDWEDRYRYLIDLGRKLEPLPDDAKTEDTRVEGCVSQVWMVSRVDDGDPPRIRFDADSDSQIVKGLIAVLKAVYDGKTRDEILAADIDGVFAQLGLDKHLSPNRRNGFQAMVQRIKSWAEGGVAAE